MYVYEVLQGAVGSGLKFTIADAAGTAVDLTGATIVFSMKRNELEDAAAADVTGNCAVADVDPTAGECYRDWVDGDTDVAGLYRGQLKITDATGKSFGNPDPFWVRVKSAVNPP